MVEPGVTDQTARNSVSVVMIGGKVFVLIAHCRHGCRGVMVRGGRELMLSRWNGTQSTNAGGSIHYYDFYEIDILILNPVSCSIHVTR